MKPFQFRRRNGRIARSAWALVLSAGCLAAGLSGTTQAARAQDNAGLTIYHGDDLQAAGITLGSWGSGNAAVDTKSVYTGAGSLKVDTQGFYQGGRLIFAKPLALGPFVGNKDAYFQVVARVSTTVDTSALIASPDPGVKMVKAHPAENVRVVMITSTDHMVAINLPLDLGLDDKSKMWKILTLPMPIISTLKADDADIKEIRLFADSPITLNIGQINVAIDTTALAIAPIEEKIFPRNEKYHFVANVTSGIIPAKVSWDFDASNGIQEEARGREVDHAFTKEGDFVVTVTVSDPYKLKDPVKTTFRVHITP